MPLGFYVIMAAQFCSALADNALLIVAISLLRDIGALADELGYAAYVVGGFVRDLLLRFEENLDVDIVVEGDGIRFAQMFAKRAQARVKIHRKFF